MPTPASGTSPSTRNKIAFVSDRDGDAEIFIMDRDSNNLQQVTHNSVGDRHPSWSPDGSQIAFTREGRGVYPDIFVISDDGSSEYSLVDHHASDIWPAWSPTGEWIAFQTNRDGNWEIYLIKPDGSKLRQLTTHSADDQMPAWSLDGTRVYFQSNRGDMLQIYSVNTEGGQEKHHVASGFNYQCPRPSSVDNRLAFQSSDQDGNPEMYIEVDGHIWRVTDVGSEEKTPVWSPDGQMIAFVSARNGKFDIYFVEQDKVLSIGPSGAIWRDLVVGSGNNEDPAWWGR
jgi:Tol biopolymer transport system component